MKILKELSEFQFHKKTAVAIGKFDGVHVGHQYLIEKLLKYKNEDIETVIFTFDPAPAIFFGKAANKMIYTKEEKRSIFEQMGIDILIEFPMNHLTAQLEPLFFIEQILVEQMNVKYIVAGEDVHFGQGGAGDLQLLKKYSQHYAYELDIIDKITQNGYQVSSTKVREELELSHMQCVQQLLGHSFFVKGEVIVGNQQGRTFGFPTANLLVPCEKIIPQLGVYYSNVLIEGKRYYGISNLGYKPTINGERFIGLETFIYEYDTTIYGKEIKVELISFLRGEKVFTSIEELKLQVLKDIESGKKYFDF